MTVNRSSNFELLRILLIVFVIVLHYNDSSRQGAFSFIENATTLNKFFLYALESLSLCAVNAFLCLSGYFLSNRNNVNVRKIIHVFTVLIAFRLFSYLLGAFVHHNISLSGLLNCFIPSNYYANLYCVVFCLVPFLNLITHKLDEKKHYTFIMILTILFSIIPTITDYFMVTFSSFRNPSVSAVSLYGNGRGFTVVNFILLYYIGGFIARKNYSSLLKALATYVVSSILIFIMMIMNQSASIMYCNIFIVLQAASLVVVFKNINCQSNIVNFMAKSVWEIFCIHGMFMGLYCKKFPYNISSDTKSLVFHFVICVFGVFVCSLIWDKICSVLLMPIEKIFDKFHIFNKKISVE